MIRKFLKINIIIFFILLVSFATRAKASVLEITTEGNNLVFTTPIIVKNATFKRFDDIWIVFSEQDLSIKFDKQVLKDFGVAELERLITKNGTGIRLSFTKKTPLVTFKKDKINRINTIKLSRTGIEEQTPKKIKFRVESQRSAPSIKKLFLDTSFMLDYAYSYKTGEQYLVAIGSNKQLRYLTKQKNSGLFFLPTYSGAVMIAQDGSFLNIIDEDIVKIDNNQDRQFSQKWNKSLEFSLANFFSSTEIGLLERQRRVYDFDFSKYKPKGEYDEAMIRLNKALEGVENLNIISSLESDNLSFENESKKLDFIVIDEEVSVDVDAPKTLKNKVKKIQKTKKIKSKYLADKVLVPDFTEYKVSFLLDKLLLSSIKQNSNAQKEQINIKRMQLEAFREYYPEVLGMSKLLKQDISGRFPKNNKGLALYTLASALMKRCKDVELVPDYKAEFSSDIQLWKAYCKTEQKKHVDAVHIYQANYDRIDTYPLILKSELLVNYAKTLRALDKYEDSNNILQKLLDKLPESKKSVIKYNMALNHLYQNESKMAEREFRELVFDENPLVRYPARLEYLGMILQKDMIEKEDIIQALEELRFDFRENNTELEATKILASIYMQEDYLRKAMDLYKYISIYYNGTDSGKEATEILFNIFYNLFAKKQKTNSNLTDINRLSIFYDFMELTPSEYETSKIVLNVVDDLVKLGLNYKAIDLLNVQLKYKTKDKKVAQDLGEVLAELYLNTGQLNNANKVLSLTQKEGLIEKYTEKGKLIKAKLLLKKGKIKEAEKILKTIEDKIDSRYILARIYWQRKDYKGVSSELRDLFLKEKRDLNKDDIVNLSYLMLSSAILKDIQALEKIKELYLPILKIINLEYKLNFLIKIAGKTVNLTPDDKKNLDLWKNVIKTDNEVGDFIKKYNAKRALAF